MRQNTYCCALIGARRWPSRWRWSPRAVAATTTRTAQARHGTRRRASRRRRRSRSRSSPTSAASTTSGFNQSANEGLERGEATELGVDGARAPVSNSAERLPAEPDRGAGARQRPRSSPSASCSARRRRRSRRSSRTRSSPIIDYPVAKRAPSRTTCRPNVLGLVYRAGGRLPRRRARRRCVTKTQEACRAVGGHKIPPVDSFIAGYQQGVTNAKPAIEGPVNAYSQDFVDQAKCKEIALEPDRQGAPTSSSRSPATAASAR